MQVRDRRGIHSFRQTRVHELRTAIDIDLARGADIRVSQSLCAIGTRSLEDRHRILQTRIARRLTSSYKGCVQRQEVDVGICWVGGVGYGVCKTVC